MFSDGQARHRRTVTGHNEESSTDSSLNLRAHEERPSGSLSLSNLSSLITTPVETFWANAQVWQWCRKDIGVRCEKISM